MPLEEAESLTSDQVVVWSLALSRVVGTAEQSALTPSAFPLEESMTSSYRTPHNTLQPLPSVMPPSIDLEDLISYPDLQAR